MGKKIKGNGGAGRGREGTGRREKVQHAFSNRLFWFGENVQFLNFWIIVG